MRVLITFINETTGVDAMSDLLYFCLNDVKYLHLTSFCIYFYGMFVPLWTGQQVEEESVRHAA